MIWDFFLKFIEFFLNSVFWLFSFGGNEVTLASIPFFGDAMRVALISAVSYWNLFLEFFPYAQLPWRMFLWVIIWFELSLLVLKIFLGSRIPAHMQE